MKLGREFAGFTRADPPVRAEATNGQSSDDQRPVCFCAAGSTEGAPLAGVAVLAMSPV
ncbi:hypothetical protein SPMU_20100 [Sphingomonas mucosissima]|uniref:Uncharacterized protein n=1 Tax=Sphingomonas mucosissima TaxID=370959 RepID=A0A245ZIM2_9SPHN|nr:hypothetical protein SPMU_20100 [Sphingomonas mucosissima]